MTEDSTVPMDKSATRFELDDRQRAMLAEMGVRVWMPQTASVLPEPLSGATQTAAPPAAHLVAMSTSVAPAASGAPQMLSVPIVDISQLPAGIASMDWAQLQPAVATCTGCGLSQSRQQAILGDGLVSADWMIVGDAPGEEEDKEARSFAGPAGQLLDNMLKALSLTRDQVYLTHALKCRTPSGGVALRHLFGATSCTGPTQGDIGHGQNSCLGAFAKCRAFGQVALTSAKFSRCPGGGHLSACLPASQSSRQSQGLGRFVLGCQFGQAFKRLRLKRLRLKRLRLKRLRLKRVSMAKSSALI